MCLSDRQLSIILAFFYSGGTCKTSGLFSRLDLTFPLEFGYIDFICRYFEYGIVFTSEKVIPLWPKFIEKMNSFRSVNSCKTSLEL